MSQKLKLQGHVSEFQWKWAAAYKTKQTCFPLFFLISHGCWKGIFYWKEAQISMKKHIFITKVLQWTQMSSSLARTSRNRLEGLRFQSFPSNLIHMAHRLFPVSMELVGWAYPCYLKKCLFNETSSAKLNVHQKHNKIPIWIKHSYHVRQICLTGCCKLRPKEKIPKKSMCQEVHKNEMSPKLKWMTKVEELMHPSFWNKWEWNCSSMVK